MCYFFNGLVAIDKVYRKYLAILPCVAAVNLYPAKKEDDLLINSSREIVGDIYPAKVTGILIHACTLIYLLMKRKESQRKCQTFCTHTSEALLDEIYFF